MTRGELRAIWRRWVTDVTVPYLWSNEEFDDFLDEAETEGCRRAHLLVDSFSALTQIGFSAAEQFVPLDPRILFVRHARIGRQVLHHFSAQTLFEQNPTWESSGAGNPVAYVTDYQTGVAVLYPPPSTDGTLCLTVVRDPLEGIASDVDSPEIPSRYHRALLYWVSFRAYSKPDADAHDKQAAEDSLALFEREFGPSAGAINERFSLEQYSGQGDFQ